MFIVFEGVDRSGKTTQARLLVERLRKSGTRVRAERYPNRETAIGKMLDAYLKSESDIDDHAVHLLFAANRWECAGALRSALDAGETIVADRYAASGAVFSAAKGLDFLWCKAPDVGLPKPDLVLYLDLPHADAAQRGAFGTERYECAEMQTRVRELYEEHYCDGWVRVDASGTEAEVSARIDAAIADRR